MTVDAIREDLRAEVRRSCETVFREHNDALIRFAYKRVKSWETARELVQAAYEKIFEQDSPPTFTFLRAYIYKAVGTLCLDALKKRKIHGNRRDAVYDALYAERVEVPGPETETLHLQARELLTQALLRLGPKERMAFTLTEMEGWTVRETAEIMKSNDMAVYHLVIRAYGNLARAVGRPSFQYGGK